MFFTCIVFCMNMKRKGKLKKRSCYKISSYYILYGDGECKVGRCDWS